MQTDLIEVLLRAAEVARIRGQDLLVVQCCNTGDFYAVNEHTRRERYLEAEVIAEVSRRGEIFDYQQQTRH